MVLEKELIMKKKNKVKTHFYLNYFDKICLKYFISFSVKIKLNLKLIDAN